MHRVLLILLCLMLVDGRPAMAAPDIYALTDPGDRAEMFERLAGDPRIDGLVIRASWDRLQPEATRYDWSLLDVAFAVARRHGKKISLHILTSAYARSPEWVFAAGAARYTVDRPPMMRRRPGQDSRSEAVPWDPVYLEAYARFLMALRQHLDTSDALQWLGFMSDGTPVPEMSLIGCRNGKLGNIDYDREQYLAAWRATITAHNQAFPEIPLLVSAPVRTICMPDRDGQAFYRDLMATAPRQGRTAPLMIFAADLTAQGSDRVTNLDGGLDTVPRGFQMMWQSSDDPRNRMRGSLGSALCAGMQHNGGYFEIYKPDILNHGDAAIQAAITALHEGRCLEE